MFQLIHSLHSAVAGRGCCRALPSAMVCVFNTTTSDILGPFLVAHLDSKSSTVTTLFAHVGINLCRSALL
eukprot:11917-Eustigmatos_ZCMA.PRE.1